MFYTKRYFSQPVCWYPWEEKNQIRGKDRIGVYLLAFLNKESKREVTFKDLLCKDVIYIGETHGRTMSLISRWNQFKYSARNGNGGHAGGNTFHRLGMSLQGLFVAALPAPKQMNELKRQLLAMLIERELLWEFGQRFHRRPKCNKE